MSVEIKICGLKERENILDVLELKPDYLGFILVEDSKRFVGRDDLELLLANPRISEKAILVLRDMPLEEVLELPLGRIKGLQLHGSEDFETTEYVSEIKKSYPELIILKVMGINSLESFDFCSAYKEFVDYFLFDTKLVTPEGEVSGGLGKTFNWGLLVHYKLDTPYMLSGGLGPDNLVQALELAKKDSRLMGLDLNSKFELEPGIKDIKVLEQSFKLIRG